MDQTQDLKRTPLYQNHQKAGAKFVPFAGWEMPVQYTGVIEEHKAVRSSAGLFDVSHMGEVIISGPHALALLQYVTSNDVSKLTVGKAQYSVLPNKQGGVVDDIIVYRLAEQEYLVCVNASNAEKDFQWITANNKFGADVRNASSEYAQIAIQGPRAMGIFAKFLSCDSERVSLESFPSFTVRTDKFKTSNGKTIEFLAARTGYTGEDGVEIFCKSADASAVWEGLLAAGADAGLVPIGLGARDTLRLEACYPLYGHELTDSISALSSGVGWVVKLNKGEFIGREALLEHKAQGLKSKLVGLEVTDRGIVREGTLLFENGGAEIGHICSGTLSPTLGTAVALGFVPPRLSEIGTELQAEVRGRRISVRVRSTPFYKRQQ